MSVSELHKVVTDVDKEVVDDPGDGGPGQWSQNGHPEPVVVPVTVVHTDVIGQ